MYTLAVRRGFTARHFLVGGDWGAENLPNAHQYTLELQLKGARLNRHGFLVDIMEVEKILDGLVGYYRDSMLNEKPEFAGLNPSIENFARILCMTLDKDLQEPNVTGLKVVLWENASAWASFKIDH
jgi:6-pyruvoyltetrahydropterin/6-carboxytetrahydropterin synthase